MLFSSSLPRARRRSGRVAGRVASAALAAGVLVVFGCAAPAVADASPSPSGTGDSGTGDNGTGDSGPTEAGTAFRTATEIEQGQRATASASTGDYLYWVFPATAGQVPTVEATVTQPESASRHGAQTWRLDVYDGLRRRQACTSGANARSVSAEAESVTLRCTLRGVRSWSEPWANDPLPGAYYIRLTVTRLPERDLGLPMDVEITASARDAGGDRADGGDLPVPLNPVVRAGATASDDAATDPESADDADGDDAGDGESSLVRAVGEPEGGWGRSWWSDRWIWTAAGGALGALAGVAGYRLSRGRPRAASAQPPAGA